MHWGTDDGGGMRSACGCVRGRMVGATNGTQAWYVLIGGHHYLFCQTGHWVCQRMQRWHREVPAAARRSVRCRCTSLRQHSLHLLVHSALALYHLYQYLLCSQCGLACLAGDGVQSHPDVM
jgi:hypothetical protein